MITLSTSAQEHARQMIEAGEFTRDELSMGPDQEAALLGADNDWVRYGLFFLGRDDSIASDDRAHYRYPFGDGKLVSQAALEGIAESADINAEITASATELADLCAQGKPGEPAEEAGDGGDEGTPPKDGGPDVGENSLSSEPVTAYRELVLPQLTARNIDEANREITIPFASEEVGEQWWGREKLDITSGKVHLERIKNIGSAIMDHRWDDVVAGVRDAWVEGGLIWATLKFGRGQRATEVFNDIVDRVRRGVSFGYRILRLEIEDPDSNDPLYIVREFEVLEFTFTAVPMDFSVGSRSAMRQANSERIGQDEQQRILSLIEEAKEEARRIRGGQPNEERRVTKMTDRKTAADDNKKSVDNDTQLAAREMELEQGRRDMIMDVAAIQAEQLGRLDLVAFGRKHVKEGTSIEAFRAALMAELGTDTLQLAKSTGGGKVGMTEKDLRKYNIANVYRLAANPTDKRVQDECGFERELSEAYQPAEHENSLGDGAYIPPDVLFEGTRQLQRHMAARAAGLTDATDGAAFIEYSSGGDFIMAIYGRSAVIPHVMHVYPTGPIAMARKTAQAAGAWPNEHAAGTDIAGNYDQFKLEPKRMTLVGDFSRQLIELGSLKGNTSFITSDFADGAARSFDIGAIQGNGAGGFEGSVKGILNTTGVNTILAASMTPADDIPVTVRAMEAALIDAEADSGNYRLLTTGKMKRKMRGLASFSGSSQQFWANDQTVEGYPAQASARVPASYAAGAESAIILAEFFRMTWAWFGGLHVVRDNISRATNDEVRFVHTQYADFGVRQPKGVAICTDAPH